MELLSEFFDPIPLTAMIAVVFALVVFMVISRIVKMPEDFERKQAFRREIRSRIIINETTAAAEEESRAAAESAEAAEADAQNAETDTPPPEPTTGT